MKAKINWSKELLGWLFNGPLLIYSIIFYIIPIGWAFWLSTLNWNLMSKTRKYNFPDNFVNLFTDKRVIASFQNSFKYLFFIIIFTVIFGFLIGLLVYQLPDKIKGFVSVLFFIPYLTSGVALSVVVRYLLSYNSVFNNYLRDIFSIDIDWLKDPKWAFFVMVFLIVWKMSGYYGLFILSALEGISEDVFEASEIDGSVGIHRLFHIIIPTIIPTLTTIVVLASGLAFGIFTEPYLLTGGGPSNSTTTWLIEIYNTSFTKFNSGYGSAMALACAVQIFITVKIITVIMNKLGDKFGG